jgi:mono/diheme cytochrome c family protein
MRGREIQGKQLMRRTLSGGVIALTAAALVSASASEVQNLAAADAPGARETLAVQMGRSLALRLCSTCHDVSSNQEFPPALSNPGPSFAAIANRRDTSRETLRLFLDNRHGDISVFPMKMPDLMLTDAQKEQAVAYILSLHKAE